MAEQSIQVVNNPKVVLAPLSSAPFRASYCFLEFKQFTGYRLQTTATTSGLLGHKRPLSLPTGSWLHDQGAITLAFLSLVLWF